MWLNGALLSYGKLIPTFRSSLCRKISTSNKVLAPRGFNNSYRTLDLQPDDEAVLKISAEEMDAMNDISLEKFEVLEKKSHSDILKYGELVRRKTIEHKYFKEKGPSELNLLTWAMKQQLQYLNATDPDYWTPETLAASFPISPEGVQKLLKNIKLLSSEEEIAKHDKTVVARWRKLTNGKLGSSRLLEHAIASRLSSSNSTTNVPVICPSQDQVLSTLESLRFEGDEKPFQAKALRPKQKIDKYNKHQKIKSGSFASIITDYNAQRVDKNLKPDNKTQNVDFVKEQNLERISEGPIKYEGNYRQVCGLSAPVSKSKKNSKVKYLTFDDFMLKKQKESGK